MQPRRLACDLTTLVLVLSFTLTGCLTRVPTGEIPPFRNGVTTAKRQALDAFGAINSLTRSAEIDSAVRIDALDEEDFAVPLKPEDIAQWSTAFSLVEAYATLLQQLLAPERRQEVEASLRKLGEQIQKQTDRVPPGAAAAFERLGGALVQVYAERRALAIARAFDPYAQDVFRTLAGLIGDSQSTGLRGTAAAAWSAQLGTVEHEFRSLALRKPPPRDLAKRKRGLATRYVTMLDLRTEFDSSLLSLRESLEALADAHASLAAGDRPGAETMLQIVRDEYEGFTDAKKHFEKLRKSAAPQEEVS